MHARNRIAVPRGVVEGHPAARSGAPVRAILDHFDRSSQSKMARADTICSQERRGRVRAWSLREPPQVFGHEPRPDVPSALVRAMFHHCRGLLGQCTHKQMQALWDLTCVGGELGWYVVQFGVCVRSCGC